MPPITIGVPGKQAESALQLVVNYAAPARDVHFEVGKATRVEFELDGTKAVGGNAAARFLASLSPSADRLLGETPEEAAQVTQWLTFVHTELSPLLDDKLAHVNDWLSTRTYLAGHTLTLADLAVYAAVHAFVCGFPAAQHAHFCNVLRWYDLIHHTADPAALFPAPQFVKPRLVLPEPPAPPPPKAAAKAGGAAGTSAAAAAPPAADVKPAGQAPPKAVASAGLQGAEGEKQEKKAKKHKGGAAPAAPTSPDAAAQPPGDGVAVDLLDIRVGQIISVGRHPNADSLYVEEIDLGEGAPRQVVSGLVKFVPEAAMAGRCVLVVTNLKPAKMRDVMSYGMVLCASNDTHDQVDPVNPPEGVPLGERVTFEGYSREPEALLNPKRKTWEKIAPELVTDASGVCMYRGVPFMTSKGPVTATIPNAHVA